MQKLDPESQITLQDDEEEEPSSTGTAEHVSRGIQWVKKHPVLAAVVWMFGGSENATEYYNELVEQAKSQSSQSIINTDSKDVSQNIEQNVKIEKRDRHPFGKSLSWSDHHGKSLAEYFDEV
mmetsp:Transcript_7211/g.9397  ORF Transcript_7211/g.9397 Transcript_7211/m.9397 type:complete len:122 (-) Transcript_7211:1111-1476(-)